MNKVSNGVTPSPTFIERKGLEERIKAMVYDFEKQHKVDLQVIYSEGIVEVTAHP